MYSTLSPLLLQHGGMMWGDGWMWGGGGILMALFWLALLVLIIVLILRLLGRGGSWGGGKTDRSAQEILKERYARGEIDRETYKRMLEDVR